MRKSPFRIKNPGVKLSDDLELNFSRFYGFI